MWRALPALAVLLAAAVAGGWSGRESAAAGPCAATHQYLGNYPQDREPGWSVEFQGIAHDAGNWFMTQRDWLWKFPLAHDLNAGVTGPDPLRGILRQRIPPLLRQLGYNHFGDPDQTRGFVLVPLEGAQPPRIAVFRASDLGYVTSTPLETRISQQTKGGWLAVSPDGLLYSSNSTISSSDRAFRYRVDWDYLRRRGHLVLDLHSRFWVNDEQGRPLKLETMQGGVFSPSGCLYLLNGYYTKHFTPDGIGVYDPRTFRRTAQSTNTRGQPFEYEFNPGCCDEEPEGLDWWNLDGRGAPGIRGQLHAGMLDNDSNADDIYFKHYAVR
jgi:hypothetical protein